ncbi:MAG: hypothetical protein ACKOGI_03335 [Vulcanococcus sp.]
MSLPPAPTSRRVCHAAGPRLYRLVDQSGEPHPVLDDLYDSLESAWSEALHWWNDNFGPEQQVIGIGVEVSTASGDWRTLRHPGS